MTKPSDLADVRHQLAAALIELDQLRRENAELRHELGLRPSVKAKVMAAPADRNGGEPSAVLGTVEKVALFRKLFRGRTGIFPVRWENKAGKSG